MAAFSVWSAGFSPAARYLVPLVPLAAAPVAQASDAHGAIRIAALPLVVFQALIIAVVWQYPRTLWPKEQGTNDALASIPWIGRAYERLLPSILTGDSIAWGVTVLAGRSPREAQRLCGVLADQGRREPDPWTTSGVTGRSCRYLANRSKMSTSSFICF